MTTRKLRRFTVAAMALSVVATGLALMTASPAQATSTIGGTITRSEVITRALFWYNQGSSLPPYDESRKKGTLIPDSTGTLYGADCSGFVSMAWHLPTGTTGGPNTGGLPGYATLLAESPSDSTDLRPGDILDDPGAHTFMFDNWVSASDHSQGFWAYSFGGNPITHRIRYFSESTWYTHPESDYHAYRYDNIVDDPTVTDTAFDGHQMVDLNGDGRPELIARNTNGTLVAYPHVAGNYSIASNAWTSPVTIGAGWNVYDRIMFADLNGDGRPEIIARNPNVDNGELVVYPHIAGVSAIAGSSWGTPFMIGAGWNAFDTISFADINHDGLPEIIARNPSISNGELMAYPHVAGVTTIATSSWSAPVEVGVGWNIFNMISFADIDGDGYPDILAKNPSTGNGTLSAYRHVPGQTTIAVGMWQPAITVGTGWNIYTAINTGFLDNDGYPEIVARNPAGNGSLVAYPHVPNDSTIAAGMWEPGVTIGAGWNIFDRIM